MDVGRERGQDQEEPAEEACVTGVEAGGQEAGAGGQAPGAGEVRIGPTAGLLAGLQAGLVGVLLMLAWLGVSAVWQQRSFWTAENLMASVFYGTGSIHSGIATRTLPGLALYIAIYCTMGALIGLLLRGRLTRLRTALVCIVLAMIWYYVSFRWLWVRVMPLVALLHAERPTAIGHLIYGLCLGRFPGYLRKGVGD